MTTPSDIILQALKKAGVIGSGQPASAEDFNDAFLDLNDMMAQWLRERWLVWDLRTVSFVSTGAQSYTIGTGGNFNVARPDRIESAYLRQLNNTSINYVDYPLEILESREDYNKISLKTLGTFSRYIFYQSSYPIGLLYPWPLPQASLYELFVSIKDPALMVFTSLAETIAMPPEYIAAIKFNLAVRLRVNYQLPQRDDLIVLADTSLNTIRNANAQVPRLMMPSDLTRKGNYNIYSDQVR